MHKRRLTTQHVLVSYCPNFYCSSEKAVEAKLEDEARREASRRSKVQSLAEMDRWLP